MPHKVIGYTCDMFIYMMYIFKIKLNTAKFYFANILKQKVNNTGFCTCVHQDCDKKKKEKER